MKRWPAHIERHRAAVEAHFPADTEADLRRRAGLSYLLDHATKSADKADNPDVAMIWASVESMAARHRLAGMSSERLAAVYAAVGRMSHLAMEMEISLG